ncbi:ABC transporter substrate-binding protein [Rhodococcus sp. W8901]|uniref:ABC transporter substrate-binding protein n=1 Tax=Rhodococcus sp. W8901 TaxID=2742603 RepID=UPI0015829CCB|nr:ABC transporter substrate-binding protein [Rhodococcus sp. W8901]QKT12456.1 polyamine ABC transporter substrate-binding protein [Rhodococcus sp. W8901]
MKRRLALTAIALAVGASASLTACTPGTSSASELVVTTFGGEWQKNFTDAVVKPFEKENNVTVKQVTLYSSDALAQLQAQKSSPQMDVVFFSGGQEAVAAKDGLLAPIDPSALTNGPDLIAQATSDLAGGQGPVVQITPMGLLYRTDKIDEPTSWNDAFNPEYRQHVAFTDLSNSYGTLGMLMINGTRGGTIDDVAPGIDAIGQSARAGDSIITKTSSDLQQAFAARDIWLAPYSQDYAETLRKAGQPVGFTMPREGTTGSFITANVVAGRPNTDLATKFIDYALSAGAQEKFVTGMAYSPVNTKAAVPADMQSKILSGPTLEKLVRFDPAQITGKSAAWQNQWQEQIAR